MGPKGMDGGDESALQPYGQGAQDEDEEAHMIEDALCPPDDEVEYTLAKLVGMEAVKNQFRGLRRTIEMEGPNKLVPRHMALLGNAGTGLNALARMLVPLLHKIGAVKNPIVVEAGRDDFVDRKSEARTVFKTRALLEKAAGGVLFIDEAYTLLPSTARPRSRDHGAAALREVARSLATGSPLVVLTGTASDVQRILTSDIGFKGHFLTRINFLDPTPTEIAHQFMVKLHQKGLVTGEGLTVDYLADLIENNTDSEWRVERQVADLLMQGVRAEMRKRLAAGDEISRASLSPMKMLSQGAQRMPSHKPEEVYVTVEDVQNAIVNGM